jgi:hypothetical protein
MFFVVEMMIIIVNVNVVVIKLVIVNNQKDFAFVIKKKENINGSMII